MGRHELDLQVEVRTRDRVGSRTVREPEDAEAHRVVDIDVGVRPVDQDPREAREPESVTRAETGREVPVLGVPARGAARGGVVEEMILVRLRTISGRGDARQLGVTERPEGRVDAARRVIGERDRKACGGSPDHEGAVLLGVVGEHHLVLVGARGKVPNGFVRRPLEFRIDERRAVEEHEDVGGRRGGVRGPGDADGVRDGGRA